MFHSQMGRLSKGADFIAKTAVNLDIDRWSDQPTATSVLKTAAGSRADQRHCAYVSTTHGLIGKLSHCVIQTISWEDP